MKIDKTVENLKRLHEQYSEQVRLLTEKRERITEHLQEATEHMVQTFEAIQVLEGKPTLTSLIEKSASKIEDEPILGDLQGVDAVPPIPEGLPPAEPGMKWVRRMVPNAIGELEEADVMVPINETVPKAAPQAPVGPILPPLNDEFVSPEDMLL